MSLADKALQTNEERIEWVLSHPRMSPWLKEALRGARKRDPVDVLADLDVLNLLLRKDCETRIRITFPGSKPGQVGVLSPGERAEATTGTDYQTDHSHSIVPGGFDVTS